VTVKHCPAGRRGVFPRGLLFALTLAVFLPWTVSAGGRREVATETAEGTDIWRHEFNVSHLKPGTYNIIVNAKDAAGNVGTGGPFNVRVDPLANLPEVRVVYPEHGQVVRGDVHIVGVARARYGLKEVHVKIDGGEYRAVEGAREYWDLRIPKENLPEGKHTVYARAVDNNNNTGPEIKTEFTLDFNVPAIELTSHEIGDYISGNTKISGRVSDANGLKSLEISTDGEKFTRLGHSAKARDPSWYFQFTVKTKKGKQQIIPDGPLVYYIRAVDKTDAAVTRPFLFFINNYAPQIEILSPDPEEFVYGRTQITGRVISAVGLKEFYYEWANERRDIPLRPGDPFWAVTFPISMANNRAIPFRVTAVDKSGNSTTVMQRFYDRRQFRTPTLVIDYPPPPRWPGRMTLEHDQPIYGHVASGFFPYAILLEGTVEYIPAQPFFRIDPWQIPTGRQTIRLWAMDDDLATGAVVNLNINKAAAPAGYAPTQTSLTMESPAAYEPGEDISWAGETVTVRGAVNGYSPGQALEYRLKWDDRWKPVNLDARGRFNETVSLSGVPEGPVPMELRTILNGRADTPYFLPVNKSSTLPAIRFMTPQERFGPAHRGMTTSGVVEYYVPLKEISFSYDGVEYEPMEFTAKAGRALFHGFFDYTEMYYNGETLRIRVIDKAGNVVEASPDTPFDDSEDHPLIILNSPLDGELVTGDFSVSGLAKAPIEVATVYWRIRSPANPWDRVETTLARPAPPFSEIKTAHKYNFVLTAGDVRDGANILEIFAEDALGLAGEVTRRVFRVSTAAPETVVREPPADVWVHGNVSVRGTAFDLNGVEDVFISMDNGLSYQRADYISRQTEASVWSIALNTRSYEDGVYSMLVRTVDEYGVSAFSNGIINIDNTPPDIDIVSPGDGDTVGAMFHLNGQVYDNLDIQGVYIELVNINNPQVNMSRNLSNDNIIMERVNVSSFPDGDYNLRISAFDNAKNETVETRNITVQKARAAAQVAFFNPMPGIDHTGPLTVSGRVTGAVIPEQVTLLLNGRIFTDVDVNRYGIFRHEFVVDEINLPLTLAFSATFQSPDGARIVSHEHVVNLDHYGPVIIVDSHRDGDVITGRPYISGRALMARTEEEERLFPIRVTSAVTAVEISLDNGLTYIRADGTNNWKYRLETSDLPDGVLPVLIKATYYDGRTAARRILLTVDAKAPVVNVLGPPENSPHRDTIAVYGAAKEEYEMDTVELTLRHGDKAVYTVPAFIQGLYFDTSVLGNLLFSTGIGLTFFDDNVKVQGVVARGADNSRYSNWAFGVKILANVYTQNIGRWFGPDWGFWTTSFTLGAQFLYFLMEEGEEPLWMGKFLGQWEIVKADMSFFFPDWKYFKTYSLYTEFGVWFAPSDVNSEQAWRIRPAMSFGVRFSLF
jgi:hypothetical protein